MKFQNVFFLLTVFVAISILFGCSSADSPMVPAGPDAGVERTSDNSRRILYTFRVAFNPEDASVVVVPTRNADFHANVTDYVLPPSCMDCVAIVGSNYKPAFEQWDLNVQLKNPTLITGYDVRGLVYNLGDKYILNSDGYMKNYLSQDISYKSFAKTIGQRAFAEYAVHQETYLFHFPAGSNWNTVDFIVDASWPGNAKEPFIENVIFPAVLESGSDVATINVLGYDHQGDSFTLTADFTSIGGTVTQLYDDGAHSDGPSGDGIFGATGIMATVGAGDYVIGLQAVDTSMKYAYNSFHVTVTEAANIPPVIDEITMSRTTCQKGSTTEKITLQCFANDDNIGDVLEYHWTAAFGILENEYGATTVWQPPNAIGNYYVNCEVSDGNGGFDDADSGRIRTCTHAVKLPSPGPDFTSERLEGTGSFHLTDYTPGNVVLLNFWNTW
jgi:hypothetical protein